jgi:hypothetical protein
MFRVVENKVVNGENGKVVVEHKPGMRRVAWHKDKLAIAYRFAVDVLPGITFPATIQAIGHHGPQGLWVLLATGAFYLYHAGTRECAYNGKVIGKDEWGVVGCVDGVMDTEHGVFYALREDGEVTTLSPILPVPFSLAGEHLPLIKTHLLTTDDLPWKDILLKGAQPKPTLKGPLEMVPPPSEGLAAKPLRIVKSGDYIILVFAEGRLDLLKPGNKLYLLDSLDVQDRIEDALSTRESCVNVFTPSGAFQLYIEKDGKFTLTPPPRTTQITNDFLEISVDDSVTSMDFVYHAEGLRNDLPHFQIPLDDLKGIVFPVNSEKALYLSSLIENDLIPFLSNFENGQCQLMAKSKQLLTYALLLKEQQLSKAHVQINNMHDALQGVRERMERINQRICRLSDVKDAHKLAALQNFTERVQKLLKNETAEISVERVTEMLENRNLLL